jgi:ATP-binding protein involved in chromosome partitioning
MNYNTAIQQAFARFQLSEFAINFSDVAKLQQVHLDTDGLHIEITLNFAVANDLHTLREQFCQYLQAQIPGLPLLQVTFHQKIQPHVVQAGLKPLSGVKNVIAVASGKGGVGKSTISVNLAVALQRQGARVGILDADIYGPSQPHLLGAHRGANSADGEKIQPVVSHGVQSMSIGYLLDGDDTAMIWRGPMVSSALQQLLQDTAWDNVDYLIIDLPPGTGDIQLTMAQKIPVTGAVVVTTPQDIALLDVQKAITMFAKVHIPVLGIIENMSSYLCPHCGQQDNIFGEGGAARLAEDKQLALLAQIPLDTHIRSLADQGLPIVAVKPEHVASVAYQQAALQLSLKVAQLRRDFSGAMPGVKVEHP